jgi:hypothetical protein
MDDELDQERLDLRVRRQALEAEHARLKATRMTEMVMCDTTWNWQPTRRTCAPMRGKLAAFRRERGLPDPELG